MTDQTAPAGGVPVDPEEAADALRLFRAVTAIRAAREKVTARMGDPDRDVPVLHVLHDLLIELDLGLSEFYADWHLNEAHREHDFRGGVPVDPPERDRDRPPFIPWEGCSHPSGLHTLDPARTGDLIECAYCGAVWGQDEERTVGDISPLDEALLAVDENACPNAWFGCKETYNGAHGCDRELHHGGRCRCACGATTITVPPLAAAPAAGGVVQPPADREDVADLAAFLQSHMQEATAVKMAVYLLDHQGYRRVPAGHQVVPDGAVTTARQWVNGLNMWLRGEPNGLTAEEMLERVRDALHETFGAAGGEGTDGD